MNPLPLHPRGYSADLPATGAWRPGDPPGDRIFVDLELDHPFALEGGGVLREITVAYECWGELDARASNAVLVCHALTGDSHAGGGDVPGHHGAGWWSELIGSGKALDTDRYFVVCANVLGGCQGTTGPASIDPDTGRPYGSRFPVVTVRDMVRVQEMLSRRIGIERWLTVVGGSMGGMQVLEWAVMYPQRVRAIAPLATNLAASAQQIAWSAIGRTALALDPRWRGGDYYDAEAGHGPHAGLAIARALAQITYRSDQVFSDRFGRDLVDPQRVYELWDRFQVESYLDYHGEKLARRFDANSYLVLNRAMDLHDLGRGRGGVGRAVRRIRGPVLTLSITSDTLYHPHQQQEISARLRDLGVDCDHALVDSPVGHDAFLVETDAVGAALVDHLEKAEKADV